jgi:hypothetical protein
VDQTSAETLDQPSAVQVEGENEQLMDQWKDWVDSPETLALHTQKENKGHVLLFFNFQAKPKILAIFWPSFDKKESL